MAGSVSGILLLLALVFVGPLIWAGYGYYTKHRKKDAPLQDAASEADREEQSTVDYMLGLLGYAIGIGNVWRFPYLVGKYGGCAFVFAYVVCLVLVAMPLYMMELIMGQHTRLSTVPCFTMIRPRWRGLGYAQALLVAYALSYYNVLLAYAVIYIVGALIEPLPWSEEALPPENGVGSAERFWNERVLNKYPNDPGGGELGPLQGKIVGALFFVWFLVFVSMAFGKKVLAKITWVTVLGPVILMFILIIQTAQLEGAGKGIEFYIGKFDGSQLKNLEVWAAACSQILFSLSPGMGTAITLSSYVKPNADVYRVCLIVALSNSAFSICGGFAIFSVLGSLAHQSGHTVAEIASRSGTGLAFVTIAEGCATSFGSAGNAVSVLFFLMLLTLGLDSTFAWAETFVSHLKDAGDELGGRFQRPRWEVVLFSCLLFFIVGLPFCTRRGIQVLDVCDWFGVAYFLLFGCFLESIMFHLDFGGLQRLNGALHAATKDNPKPRQLVPAWYWNACFFVTIPVFTGGLFIYNLVHDIKDPYGGYAKGFQAFGWIIMLSLLIIAPLTFLDKSPGTLPDCPTGSCPRRQNGMFPWSKDKAKTVEDGKDATARSHVASSPSRAALGPQPSANPVARFLSTITRSLRPRNRIVMAEDGDGALQLTDSAQRGATSSERIDPFRCSSGAPLSSGIDARNRPLVVEDNYVGA